MRSLPGGSSSCVCRKYQGRASPCTLQNIFIKSAKRCRHMIGLALLYTHTARVLQIN
ncbi:hypothetical protein VKUWNCZY_CDS0082 [Escherichia phage KS_A8]